MTTGHLLFAVDTTLYIIIALKYFEERDPKKEIGEAYGSCQKRVPMFILLSNLVILKFEFIIFIKGIEKVRFQ